MAYIMKCGNNFFSEVNCSNSRILLLMFIFTNIDINAYNTNAKICKYD
jgi:hypothetical protein